VSPAILTDSYFEFKRAQSEAMRLVPPVIKQIGEEFGQKFGRGYGLFEEYRLDDAEVAIVVMGSTAGTARVAIDGLRRQGHRVGMLKLRSFRPFPHQELAQTLSRFKAVAVMDRSDSMSSFGGPLFIEIRSALYDLKARPTLVNYIYGLGGRDIKVPMIEQVFQDLLRIREGGTAENLISYLGVRED
jgi:pyruvate ferredoxin oxidoreductase alpha subunit